VRPSLCAAALATTLGLVAIGSANPAAAAPTVSVSTHTLNVTVGTAGAT
jgi:hypothetical protein